MTADRSRTPEVYRLLAAAHNAAADKAILCALPHLEREYRRVALKVLIRRRRPWALLTLVSGFASYPEDLQGDVLARAASFEPALRMAIRHEDSGLRLGAIRLIAKSGDCRLAYLLNSAWSQPDPATRELAGKALLAFADRHLTHRSTIADDQSAARVQSERRHLAPALGRALQCWELHTRTEVLTAAAWLADLTVQDIADKIAQPRSRLAHAFNSLLSTRPDPRFAAYVLRALTIPALHAGAARIIGHCQDDAFMTALIDECWLLKDPGVRKACSAVRDLKWVSGSIDPLLRLGGEKAAAAMRFAAATGLSNDAKVGLFRDMIASGDSCLRRAALWQLVTIDTDAATEVLRIAAGRKDSPIATMACHELRRRKPVSPAWTQTPRARDSTTASADATSLSQEELDEFFDAFALLDEDGRKPALQNPMLKTPAAARCLRAKLASSDADERARTLRIVCAAGLIDEMEDRIYRLANDSDATVRSNAVAMLAHLANPTSIRILRRALQDPDGRVQANAIEALDTLEVDQYEKWIESKLESPSSRVRANTIKALLRWDVRRAADTLLDMLESDVRGERLSALWVVEHAGLGSLLDRVRGLAQNDADVEVRRRAAGIAQAFSSSATGVGAMSYTDIVMGQEEP